MRRDDLGMLSILLGAVFVVLLNETLTGVSLPVIAAGLGTDIRSAQWATSGYLLTLAVLLPLTGRLLNRVPTRALFRVSCAVLLLGVAVSAAAPDVFWLVAGRVVQAAGSVALIPMLLTAVLRMTSRANRGRALSLTSLTTAIAPALGPSAAGLVLAIAGWRALFAVQLPLYAALLLLARFVGRDLRSAESAGGVDVLSVALSALGFGGIVIAASASGGLDDDGLVTIVALAAGVLGIAGFVWRQLAAGAERATLDLTTFRAAGFPRSVVVLALALAALFSVFALFPLLLLGLVGLTPLQAGLLMLPGGLTMGALAPFAGRLTDAGRARGTMVTALALLAAALAGSAALAVSATHQPAGWPVWLAAHLTIGIAFALLITPLYATALAHIPERQHPHAGAILGVTQQLSAAIGTAAAIGLATAGARSGAAVTGAGAAVALALGCGMAIAAAWVAASRRRRST
jgi:DHA2 family lincomycin resistance protein-like MFS transporter